MSKIAQRQVKLHRPPESNVETPACNVPDYAQDGYDTLLPDAFIEMLGQPPQERPWHQKLWCALSALLTKLLRLGTGGGGRASQTRGGRQP